MRKIIVDEKEIVTNYGEKQWIILCQVMIYQIIYYIQKIMENQHKIF